MDRRLPIGYCVQEFQIEDYIGSGGFALTYLCSDTNLGRRCLLKELFPDELVYRDTNFQVVAREGKDYAEYWQTSLTSFEKEAKALAGLRHANIPEFIGYIKANQTIYLVQEFVEGEPLDKWLVTQSAPLSHRRVEFLLTELLQTLEFIHNQGVLHRDIKPPNIVIRAADGRPVLIDYGAVRTQVGGVTHNLHERVETPGFSPIEQITSGKAQDESSDLYSLAATFYWMLFREVPPAAADRIVGSLDKSFNEADGQYSERLLSSLDQAFAWNRKDRFTNSRAWLTHLEGKQGTPEEIDNSAVITEKSEFYQPPVAARDISDYVKVIEHESILEKWSVGRDPELADVALSDADDAASRVHFELYVMQDGYYILDLSSNGTWVEEESSGDKQKHKVDGAVKLLDANYIINMAGNRYRLGSILRYIEQLKSGQGS